MRSLRFAVALFVALPVVMPLAEYGSRAPARAATPIKVQDDICGGNVALLHHIADWDAYPGVTFDIHHGSPATFTNVVGSLSQSMTSAASGFTYGLTVSNPIAPTTDETGLYFNLYDYPPNYPTGGVDPSFVGNDLQYGDVSTLGDSFTATVTEQNSGPLRLQFTLVDVDYTEYFQIAGYNGATLVLPTITPRSNAAGAVQVTSTANYIQAASGANNTGYNDWDPLATADVYFSSPVTSIVMLHGGTGGSSTSSQMLACGAVDAVKSAGTLTYPSSTVIDVPYTVLVGDTESTGNLTDYNVQVSENLANTFPTAQSVSIVGGSYTVSGSGSACAINGSFNGTSNFGLLSGAGNLSPGQSCTIHFTAQVSYPTPASVPTTPQSNQVYASTTAINAAANAGGTYSGTTWTAPTGAFDTDTSTNATALPSTPGGDTPSATSVTFSPPVSPPSLSMTKTTNAASWPVGTNVGNYTLAVTNTGTTATSGTITVTDTLPSGLTINGTPSGGAFTCTVTGGTQLNCTSSTSIGIGATASFNVNVNVAAGTPASVTNTAGVYGGGDPVHTNASNEATGSVTQTILEPNLTIAKTDNGPWTLGQGGAHYTLTVKNTGGAATSGTINVQDTLPAGITVNGGNPSGGGFTCTVTGGNLVACTSTTALAVNASTNFNINVTVAAGAVNPTVNTAYSWGGGDPTHTTLGTAASGTDSTTVNLPNLTIAKTDNGPWNVNQGGAHYTLTVKNTGAGPTSGTLTIADTLPTGLTVNGTPGGAGYTCTVTGGTQITCTTSAALNANQSQNFNVNVNVTSGTPYSVTNTADFYGGGDPVHTSLGTAATGSDTTTINNVPGLAVTKTDNGGGSGWTIGQAGAIYTVTVKNVGSGPTTGTITVADTLPSNLTANGNPTGMGWTCTGNGTATISCTSSTAIASNGSSAISVPVTIGAGTPTGTNSITNTVSAYGGGDPIHATAGTATTGTDATTVHSAPAASLTVTKTDNGGAGGWTIAQTGAQYTVTIGNAGNLATSGTINVSDTLPTGLTNNGTPTGTGWSCSVTGNTQFTCTSTTAIPAGGSGNPITVPVNIGDNTPTGTNSITNTAASYGGGDPVHTNSSNAATGPRSTTVGYAATTFAIGPYQNSNASGSYDGVVASNNNNDFTAVNVQRGGNPQVDSNGNGVPLSVTLSAATAPCIPHSFIVLTGGGQAFSVTATAPSGWQVGLFANASCTTLLGGATIGATSTAGLGDIDYTAPATTVYSQYTSSGAITITPFLRYDAVLSSYITGQQAQGTNTTHDELFYGYLSLLKTQAILNSTCPGRTWAVSGLDDPVRHRLHERDAGGLRRERRCARPETLPVCHEFLGQRGRDQ